MYICDCGKEFDNPQKFNGHKQGCKIHIEKKYGSLENYYLIKNRNHSQGSAKLHENHEREKAAENQKWISEQHTCEKCGKVMTEKFGSGRFCSRFCANSHTQTEAQNIARRNKLLKNPVFISLQDSNKAESAAQDRFCKNCGKKISNRSKSGYCRDCFHKCVPYSEEAKQKQHNKMIGRSRWNIHRNQTSYAEKFFINVLTTNNIEFKREFQVKTSDNIHCYFLDFLLPKNVDLEIDGAQHKYRKDTDRIRDEYLQSLNYIIYRIDWNEINSKAGKLKMKEKIDAFLYFYNNL